MIDFIDVQLTQFNWRSIKIPTFTRDPSLIEVSYVTQRADNGIVLSYQELLSITKVRSWLVRRSKTRKYKKIVEKTSKIISFLN